MVDLIHAGAETCQTRKQRTRPHQQVVPLHLKVICLTVALSLIVNGCAILNTKTPRNPAESPRPNPSELIVAPARYEPASKLDPVMRTKGEAAAQGAAGGAMAGIAGTFHAMAGGGPLAIVLLPVFVPLGAVIGATTEPSKAAPKELIEKGRMAIGQAISMLQVQARMEKALVAELRSEAVARSMSSNWEIGPQKPGEVPDYLGIAAPMVLEVSVLEFGFSSGVSRLGKEGYRLDLTTHSRLVDTTSNNVMDKMKHIHNSDVHSATEWLQDDAEIFVHSVNDALRMTAHAMVLELFRLYYPPASAEPEGDEKALVPYYVLRPIYPEPRRGIDLRGAFLEKYLGGCCDIKFSHVDSLQPTFRWERFPRQLDISAAGDLPGRFSDVSYEITIYKAEKARSQYVAGPLFYTRIHLLDPQHQIEVPLQPCGRYAWTVRARFLMDGQPRSTEWTGAYNAVGIKRMPWKYRRSDLKPSWDGVMDPRDMFLVFRAPPAHGAAECGD